MSSAKIEKSVVIPKGTNIKWLLGSGCSDHIINTDKYFYESTGLRNTVEIKVDDGFILKFEKIGNIMICFNVSGQSDKIKVKNVYYVPKMKQNLLSVSCIINQDNIILFEKDDAKIYNFQEKLLAAAVKRNKLY